MRRLACGALVAVLAACGPRGAARPPQSPEPPPRVSAAAGADLLLVAGAAEAAAAAVPVVRVEVAATFRARERGLGGRETLPDGRGMLFVYPDSRRRSFWMKDCLVALDIAFLDVDGRILDVATLPPGAGLADAAIPAAACEGPVRYVLEVRARWFAEQGIARGSVVDVEHAVRGVVPE